MLQLPDNNRRFAALPAQYSAACDPAAYHCLGSRAGAIFSEHVMGPLGLFVIARGFSSWFVRDSVVVTWLPLAVSVS